MTPLYLRNNVYVCITEDAAIFLDLDRDKYTGLEKSHAATLRSLIAPGGTSAPINRGLIEKLLGRGFLTDDVTNGREWIELELGQANRTLIDLDADIAPPRTPQYRKWFRGLLNAYLTSLLLLKWRSLKVAVGRVRRRKEAAGVTSSEFDYDHARELTSAFHVLSPLLYTASRQCLLDSLVLTEFLASNGLFPSWVLGVRTGPFRAHSWVQHEDFILNDSPAFTRAYIPILIA